jgi:hypothetical protein
MGEPTIRAVGDHAPTLTFDLDKYHLRWTKHLKMRELYDKRDSAAALASGRGFIWRKN